MIISNPSPPATSVDVNNFPAIQDVDVISFPTSPDVVVSNFPATQDVKVTNNASSLTLNDQAFSGYAASGSAANSFMVQLWNPTTSTVDLFIYGMMLSATASTTAYISFNTSAASFSRGQGTSILSGSSVQSTGLFYGELSSTPPGTVTPLASFLLGAGAAITPNFRTPMVVKPGFGFVAYGSGTSVILTATWWWTEA